MRHEKTSLKQSADPFDLRRFVDAQNVVIDEVFSEKACEESYCAVCVRTTGTRLELRISDH